MCGRSEAEIDGAEVRIYLGWFGGTLRVGDVIYNTDGHYSDFPSEEPPDDPEEIRGALAVYSKEQIIGLLVDLTNNAREADGR